jgi:hypothetical protein
MAKRASRSINLDMDPSSEFDFDSPYVVSPAEQKKRLNAKIEAYNGDVAAAKKSFKTSFGYAYGTPQARH